HGASCTAAGVALRGSAPVVVEEGRLGLLECRIEPAAPREAPAYELVNRGDGTFELKPGDDFEWTQMLFDLSAQYEMPIDFDDAIVLTAPAGVDLQAVLAEAVSGEADTETHPAIRVGERGEAWLVSTPSPVAVEVASGGRLHEMTTSELTAARASASGAGD